MDKARNQSYKKETEETNTSLTMSTRERIYKNVK